MAPCEFSCLHNLQQGANYFPFKMAPVNEKILIYTFLNNPVGKKKNTVLGRDQIMSVTGQRTPNKLS